jgi:hypothetical protein
MEESTAAKVINILADGIKEQDDVSVPESSSFRR